MGWPKSVAEHGPLFFPELGTAIGTRSIVVDHTGDDPADGWRVYWAYPADRESTCLVEQVPGTAQFLDCDGRTIDVSRTVATRRRRVPDRRGRQDARNRRPWRDARQPTPNT